eukprot:m.165472 g.165472  ORF g.165472 m.165472 type:complete len:220 (-) comp17159_c0_seq1:63-722(-)
MSRPKSDDLVAFLAAKQILQSPDATDLCRQIARKINFQVASLAAASGITDISLPTLRLQAARQVAFQMIEKIEREVAMLAPVEVQQKRKAEDGIGAGVGDTPSAQRMRTGDHHDYLPGGSGAGGSGNGLDPADYHHGGPNSGAAGAAVQVPMHAMYVDPHTGAATPAVGGVGASQQQQTSPSQNQQQQSGDGASSAAAAAAAAKEGGRAAGWSAQSCCP